jgi:hypothetical protein
MRINRGLIGLAAAVLVAAPVGAQDEVSEWPERAIEFEVSDEPLELKDFQARPGQIWPRYGATFAIDTGGLPLDLFRGTTEAERQTDGRQKLLGTEAAEALSMEQLDFVRMSACLQSRRELDGKYNPLGPFHYAVYAVSEQDARIMVRAVLELLDAPKRAEFEETVAWLVKYRARLAEAEEKLPEAVSKSEELHRAYEALRKAGPYRSRDVAEEDFERLRVSLRSLEVMISGINAKISAIQQRKSGGSAAVDADTSLMLDRLLIEQDIELAGALAQKQFLEAHHERAKAFLAADDAHNLSVADVSSWREVMEKSKDRVSHTEKKLRKPDRSIRPVGLTKSVTIQPIEYPGE